MDDVVVVVVSAVVVAVFSVVALLFLFSKCIKCINQQCKICYESPVG